MHIYKYNSTTQQKFYFFYNQFIPIFTLVLTLVFKLELTHTQKKIGILLFEFCLFSSSPFTQTCIKNNETNDFLGYKL